MPHVGNWKRVAKEEDAIRDRCRAIYLENRDHLARLILQEVSPDLVPALSSKVVKWMTSWEVPERQAKRLVNANIDPKGRIRYLVARIDHYKANLEAAESAYEEQPSEHNARAVSHWLRLWTEMEDRLLATEAELVVEDTKGALLDRDWKAMKDSIYRRIYRDYRGKGEVYRSICERVASLQVALLRLEEQGRMEGDTYIKLQAEFTSAVNQVQKFTEAQKVDVTETFIAEVGTRFLSLVEPLLHNQPALMDRIVNVIEGNVDRIGSGEPLRLPERVA